VGGVSLLPVDITNASLSNISRRTKIVIVLSSRSNINPFVSIAHHSCLLPPLPWMHLIRPLLHLHHRHHPQPSRLLLHPHRHQQHHLLYVPDVLPPELVEALHNMLPVVYGIFQPAADLVFTKHPSATTGADFMSTTMSDPQVRTMVTSGYKKFMGTLSPEQGTVLNQCLARPTAFMAYLGSAASKAAVLP